jgi:hypothetical protein
LAQAGDGVLNTLAKQRLALGAFGVLLAVSVVALAAWATRPQLGPVIISEIMSSNGHTLADEDGDHRDWIELANIGDEPVELGGYHLSDDPEQLTRWRFPERTLQPGEHLIVWASGKDRARGAGELHSDFRIARTGEPVLLTAPDGTSVIDRLGPVAVPRDVSYGRHPDRPTRTCYFEQPTPGEPNGTECRDEMSTRPPELEPAGGFFTDPVELELSFPDDDEAIWYTLDGSYPDPEGNPRETLTYDGPIRIVDRSGEDDRYTRFVPTVLEDWLPPDRPVPKATVVRARTRWSEEASATYFVGDHLRPDGLPVVSIASDLDHLFDRDTGIMVAGRPFEEWRWGPDYDPDYPPRWRPANYRESGRAWERPPEDDLERGIVLTYCTADGTCELTQHVGLRIHGGVSRTRAQKSLRIYARNDYGSRTIEYPFFGPAGPSTHRRLILRNSGSDWGGTMLMDGYLQSLGSHLAVDTQAYQPTVVFINGEYWGILNLRERFDRHYLAIVHGLDPDAIIFIDQPYEVTSGVDGDETPYRQMLEQLATMDPNDAAALEHVEQHVDVGNLVDYLAMHLFVSNADWPQNNVRIWRNRAEPGGEVHPGDGRWRYLVFDLDASGAFGSSLEIDRDDLARVADADRTPHHETGIPFLTGTLLQNDAFRVRFLTRYADLLNTAFEPSRTLAELDALEALLAPEMQRHTARWNQHQSVDDWHEHIDRLRTFMRQRPGIQRQQLVGYFELDGTVALHVRHDPDRGRVSVNTIDLAAGTPGVADPSDWTGEYFDGVPVTLRAVPADGQRFVRWEGLSSADATDPEVTLTAGGDVSVQAIFADE